MLAARSPLRAKLSSCFGLGDWDGGMGRWQQVGFLSEERKGVTAALLVAQSGTGLPVPRG